jgi:hypothetical protein
MQSEDDKTGVISEHKRCIQKSRNIRTRGETSRHAGPSASEIEGEQLYLVDDINHKNLTKQEGSIRSEGGQRENKRTCKDPR